LRACPSFFAEAAIMRERLSLYNIEFIYISNKITRLEVKIMSDEQQYQPRQVDKVQTGFFSKTKVTMVIIGFLVGAPLSYIFQNNFFTNNGFGWYIGMSYHFLLYIYNPEAWASDPFFGNAGQVIYLTSIACAVLFYIIGWFIERANGS